VDTERLRRRDVELQSASLHIGLSCLARAAGDEDEAATIVWQPGQLCRYGNIVLVIGRNSFGNEVCLKPPMNDDDKVNRPETMERIVNKGCLNLVLFVFYIINVSSLSIWSSSLIRRFGSF
jgi:hypothetical protein